MDKKKLMTILLAVAIAVCLWIYVVTTVTPEDSQWIYNIPVTFENEDGIFSDRNLTLTEGRNATVNLKFYGKRQDLLKLSSSNIAVAVDLSQVSGPGRWDLSYDYRLPDTVSSGSISLEARSTASIAVLVDLLEVREINVQAIFHGDISEGYAADPIEAEYQTLSISGPQDVVSQIDHAEVVLERVNLQETVSDTLPFTFVDAEGKEIESDEINCDVDKIGVIMTVNMIKEVPLTVTLSAGGGATEEHAVVDIEPKTVTLRGDAETLEVINSINLGTIDLGSIQTTYSKTFTVVTPDAMTNMTDSEATVSVELVNLKEKTFRVTNLEIANAPEELKVTLGTSSLQVKLRGAENVINAISASNIRVVVDLNLLGSNIGQFNCSASIIVDGFTDVGAMGTYNVLVTISEPVEGEGAVEVEDAYADWYQQYYAQNGTDTDAQNGTEQ